VSKYDEMEAGPELDALIATEVMEWEIKRFDDGGISIMELDIGPYATHVIHCPSHSLAQLWRPSRDIEAAWQVVEKMRSDGFGFTIKGYSDEWTSVSFYRDRPCGPFGVRTGPVPFAIGVAALEATEAKP